MTLRKIARELLLWWIHPERYIMERKIFPSLKDKKVLFVGVAPYTKEYWNKLNGNEVWSIDNNQEMSDFGAAFHVIDSITNVDKTITDSLFDYIFLVGVIGFGLNTEEEVNKAFKACYNVLNDGGKMMVWWNLTGDGKIDFDPTALDNFKLFKLMNNPKPFITSDIAVCFLAKINDGWKQYEGSNICKSFNKR